MTWLPRFPVKSSMVSFRVFLILSISLFDLWIVFLCFISLPCTVINEVSNSNSIGDILCFNLFCSSSSILFFHFLFIKRYWSSKNANRSCIVVHVWTGMQLFENYRKKRIRTSFSVFTPEWVSIWYQSQFQVFGCMILWQPFEKNNIIFALERRPTSTVILPIFSGFSSFLLFLPVPLVCAFFAISNAGWIFNRYAINKNKKRKENTTQSVWTVAKIIITTTNIKEKKECIQQWARTN